MRILTRFITALAVALALFALLDSILSGHLLRLPPRYDPFAPLNLREPPSLLNRYKLWRAMHEPALCQAALASSELQYVRVPDSTSEAGCGLENAVRVSRSSLGFSSSFLASCPLALAWAVFEKDQLQPTAQQFFGTRVSEVEHLGSYSCRNVNHASAGRLSEHAHANALDVSAFVLADGRRVSIARDWSGASVPSSFLHRVREGACESFNTTLSPDYNALHHNHLHLEMGHFHACR